MKRATANAVIQALTWRLRDLRIRVGPAEIEQAMAVLRSQDEWSETELKQVLTPIFAKRQEHRAVVSVLIDEFLTPPRQANVDPAGAGETEFKMSSDTPPPPPPRERRWQRFKNRFALVLAAKLTPHVLGVIGALLIVPVLIGLLSGVVDQLRERIGAVFAGLQGALRDPLGNSLVERGADSENLQVALLVRHAVMSSLAASGILLIFLALKLTQKKMAPTTRRRDPIVRRPSVGDGSVFRVGSLGGRPPPFLDSSLASEIVELITYRQTDRLRKDLDLRSTVDRRVRGDMDSLVFERRKELPTVVILVDAAADARHWNTLAEEFQVALEKRGLRVEALSYFSALSRPSSYASSSSDTVEATLVDLAERTGWILTAIFGDLKRLSGQDIAILAAQREQGPVLAFDYTHPRLWDIRHSHFETMGMGPFPATGYALRRALATAFAPDRGAIRAATSTIAGKPAFWHLSRPHLEWAIACAMVEPVSFSLAEQLRKAHPELSGPSEGLAFSLLSSLPEGWVSREGLRFAPSIRRELLSKASEIPRELQLAFLSVFDTAFGQEPSAETAGELWRYTRAQAELFTLRQTRALQDLADVKGGGMIDPEAFDDFVGRLRQPGAKEESGTIRLRAAIPKLSGLLSNSIPSTRPAAGETQFADWSVGLSDVRIRLNGNSSPLAAFFAEGQSFLTIDKGGAEPFSRVDAVRGIRQTMTQLTSLSNFELTPADFTQIYIFPNGQGGVLAARGGRLFTLLKGSDSDQGWLPNIALQEIKTETDLGDDPLIALSPNGSHIAYARTGSRQIAVVAAAADERPRTYRTSGALTAIAFSQQGALLGADDAGEIFEFLADDEQPNSSARDASPLATFGGPIAALADYYGDDGNRYIVVALVDGRIGIQDPGLSPRSFDLLLWRPKWLTVFSDRKAAVAGSRALGVSIAITGADGEFDIIGVDSGASVGGFDALSLLDNSIEPSRDGLAVLAINPERRRIIVRNGSYLEVRPLVYDLPEAGAEEPASKPAFVPETPSESADSGTVPA
ncbi:hypothetical protein E0H70_28220 [Rhizobium leguminosarum bv. viciae]|nr:hypothetical protein E0H70_28220 [Rhizobium leguminosarum bv. viciae]